VAPPDAAVRSISCAGGRCPRPGTPRRRRSRRWAPGAGRLRGTGPPVPLGWRRAGSGTQYVVEAPVHHHRAAVSSRDPLEAEPERQAPGGRDHRPLLEPDRLGAEPVVRVGGAACVGSPCPLLDCCSPASPGPQGPDREGGWRASPVGTRRRFGTPIPAGTGKQHAIRAGTSRWGVHPARYPPGRGAACTLTP
jgi:hypothetical protein